MLSNRLTKHSIGISSAAPKAADAFLTEIGTSLAQIASHPQLYPFYSKNTRRRILAGFPYSVIFQEKQDIILVVAVAHAKRRPVIGADESEPQIFPSEK